MRNLKTMFTAETQSAQRGMFSDPIGRRRLDQNRIPWGIESQMTRENLIQGKICVLKGQTAFCFSREVPGVNKKCFLRGLRASVVKKLFWV
jgi:hypothetical protein